MALAAKPDSRAITSLASIRVISTIDATITTGPISMTIRYSLTRFARLRGRSTCHVKLSASSTFWIMTRTV